MFFNHDSFKAEYGQFQWDVHMLIECTLDASIRFLETDSKVELEKIEQWLKTPESTQNEYREHWVDEHTDLLATNDGQEVFLRNMALVALTSRLTHSLKQMARSAESFSPAVKEDDKFENEFFVLSREYKKRFDIDFDIRPRTLFLKTLRTVRNKIVHDGAEVNTSIGCADKNFSKKCPEYVRGDGLSAEVCVTEELLNKNIAAAIELVAWLATELRKQELANEKNVSAIQ
jgi:hypothetical protein